MYMIRLIIELFDAAIVIGRDLVEKQTQSTCDLGVQYMLTIFSAPDDMELACVYGSAPIFYFVHTIYSNILYLTNQILCLLTSHVILGRFATKNNGEHDSAQRPRRGKVFAAICASQRDCTDYMQTSRRNIINQ